MTKKFSVEITDSPDIDIASECKLLRELLANSDTEANDKAYQLKSGLEKTFSAEQLELLYESLDQYDFDCALDQLDKLIPTIENTQNNNNSNS